MQYVHRMLWLALSAGPLAVHAATGGAMPAIASVDGAYRNASAEISGTVANRASLSLADALALAADANPALRGVRAAADAADGAALQAGMRPNPELSLMQEGFRGNERTSTALITQRIELGGKRGYRKDVAAYASEAARASIDARAAALQADVTAAFYGLLYSQSEVALNRELTGIANQLAALASKRANAGKISPVEATRAAIAASRAQIDTQSAEALLVSARERLASAVGVAELRERAAAGDLERLPDGGAISTLATLRERIDSAPLMRRADAESRRADATVALERARRIPDLTVSAGMKRLTAGGVPGNQAVIGISIPLPLFDTNRGALMEATHNATRAQAERDTEAARLRAGVADAYARFTGASQEARRLNGDVLPAARTAFDAMTRGFDLGKFSFLDVLDAQRTWFAVRSQYLRALTDAQLAYAEIGRYLDGAPDMPPPAYLHSTSSALPAAPVPQP